MLAALAFTALLSVLVLGGTALNEHFSETRASIGRLETQVAALEQRAGPVAGQSAGMQAGDASGESIDEQLFERAESLVAAVGELYYAGSTEQQIPALLRHIKEISDPLGLSFLSLRPVQQDPRVELSLRSGPVQIVRFLYALENARPLLRAVQMNITRSRDELLLELVLAYA